MNKKGIDNMNKKTQNIMLIIYVTAFISILAASTYAYFTYLEVKSYTPKAEVTTATLNQILFNSGNNIDIRPTLANFQDGMGNLSDSTFATAYLKHEGGDEESSLKYNISLNIESNTLIYSTETEKPELILQVSGPNGEVKEIEGLEYINVIDGDGNEIKGFDITTKVGTYYITKNRELKTMTEIEERWDITVTYVNLSESQNGNYDKELKGNIKIENGE